MIILKPVLIVVFVVSALFAAWNYRQHKQLKAMKNGAVLVMDPNDAARMQQFKDR
jgi:hypothetical protein